MRSCYVRLRNGWTGVAPHSDDYVNDDAPALFTQGRGVRRSPSNTAAVLPAVSVEGAVPVGEFDFDEHVRLG